MDLCVAQLSVFPGWNGKANGRREGMLEAAFIGAFRLELESGCCLNIFVESLKMGHPVNDSRVVGTGARAYSLSS